MKELNITKITCLMSGKTYEPAKSELHGDWITAKMKDKTSITFHKDNPNWKVKY